MRDDLLDAQAAVDWVVGQIPAFQNEFLSWQRGDPYRIVQERDPTGGSDLVVANQQTPLPRTLNAWVGALINSLRSSLDLLAAALAFRNGKKARETYFPIFASEQAMLDPRRGLDSKKWLSQNERATIRSLRPYRGGDAVLRTLHELDIARKHERLIAVSVDLNSVVMLGSWSGWRVGGVKPLQCLDGKIILGRLRPSEILNATQGNTLLSIQAVFKEASVGIVNEEVVSTLRRFAERMTEIIALFET